MLQILLKDSAGAITHVMTSLDELAKALNDPLVKTQRSLSDLYSYIMHNHYRTTINGVAYYHSNASFGINQPAIIVFTELDLPRANNLVKIVLKDQAENVLLEKEVDFNELANLLHDPQIAQCSDAADLEFYLITHHYHTTIGNAEYQHKRYSVGINHLPTFEFVKL